MIKFITESEEKKELTFADVEENQFFVYIDGCLCQKSGNYKFNYVATASGLPYAHSMSEISPSVSILRILPIVKKIEF
jgi:hypothetical protein